MDKVPAVGSARGIFEIFIPGIFLLMNIVATVYLFPLTDQGTRGQLWSLMTNPSLALLVTVPFGYLAGITLRLLPTDFSDRISAGFLRLFYLRLFYRNVRGGKRDDASYAFEAFPYTKWLATLCCSELPKQAEAFYSAFWAQGSSKQFVNFCKVIVSAKDIAAATEIYLAESLSRYLSGMFYALLVASALLVILLLARLIAGVGVGLGIPVMLGAYICGLVCILGSLRFIRIKEVEAVFAASFKNRDLFDA